MRPEYTIEVTQDGGLTWRTFAVAWNYLKALRHARIASLRSLEPRISIEWKDPGWPTKGVARSHEA